MPQTDKHQLLKHLPGVDHMLEKARQDNRFAAVPRQVLTGAIRTVLDDLRQAILAGRETGFDDTAVLLKTAALCRRKLAPNLVPLVNATGVVLHTNLGRALLCSDALANIQTIASAYSNLELNLSTGKRGLRYTAVEELICELTGAQAAMAVNNNAGAVLLALNTLAENTEVVVSRGELVEIGGSFRVPDVMVKSGCRLKEVGTTNRTHLKDYKNAVTDSTGLFLKVHASNYRIEGFTASVSLRELAYLGKTHQIPVMEDLGSGTLVDFSAYGLPAEPLVSDSVAAGADVVTFSGDKLLGGPQAGIIAGKKQAIDRIRANPLTRALRIDKLTLAALEATLRLYRDERQAVGEIPTLRMLTMSFEDTCKQAAVLEKLIQNVCTPRDTIELVDLESRPGGGSFPALTLPTRCVAIVPARMSVAALERSMRLSAPAIIARIENNRYILDPRTIQPGQETIISSTLETILATL
ncbi:MAG: L-seryl-tRNA(Sec) selenium transferase [Desulfotignum sp.]|nr:L-seryl-tRNA(Sec) selenium transferase [Desulfotignum sp.]MCF8112390.1 L-seryl-tRNA(Sec) selenium transferase [Desulfotignum sp.]MCF8125222.1 L-seryl-tRNA(Sec) selenium transferase [Desulfotignum sp.]